MNDILAAAMAKRTERGLKLTWLLPEGRLFTCFAENEEEKARRIENGNRFGWVLQ